MLELYNIKILRINLKFMTVKRFMVYRLISVMILAGIISASISMGNYILPLVAVVTFIIIFYAMKKKVSEVMEDERDYEVAGKAARYAMSIFGGASGIIAIVLFALKSRNQIYELVGSTIAYAVCGLLLTYSIIFKYFQRQGK